jgi:hypothetical protein
MNTSALVSELWQYLLTKGCTHMTYEVWKKGILMHHVVVLQDDRVVGKGADPSTDRTARAASVISDTPERPTSRGTRT